MIFFLFFAAANLKLSGRLIRPQKNGRRRRPFLSVSSMRCYTCICRSLCTYGPAQNSNSDGRGAGMDPDGNPDLVGGGPGYLVPPGFQSIKHLIRKGLILRPIQTKAGYHAPLGQIQILLGDIAVKELLHPLQGLFSPLCYAI